MSEKLIYEREVKSLIASDVDGAISYSRSPAIVGKVAEWRDRKTVGLTIRITSGKAVWYVRRRELTLRFGLLSSSWGFDRRTAGGKLELETARYIANQIHLAAGRKRNLREFADTLVRLETTSEYGDPKGYAEIADEFANESSLGLIGSVSATLEPHGRGKHSPNIFSTISFRN